jgi:ATP-binding cassette subfamily G (WHITE) protein 2 (PDR)
VENAIAANQVVERGGLFFLFIWVFLLFTSTSADMAIAGLETAEAGSNLAMMLFTLSLTFCGILASPTSIPRFWIWMYRFVFSASLL